MDRRDDLIFDLFPRSGDFGAIVYETLELPTEALLTKSAHTFEMPVQDCAFTVNVPLNRDLRDGFLIPGVTWQRRGSDEPEYYIALRLKELPCKRQLEVLATNSVCQYRISRRFEGEDAKVYIEHIVPLTALQLVAWYGYRAPLNPFTGSPQFASLEEFITGVPDDGKDPKKARNANPRAAERRQAWDLLRRPAESTTASQRAAKKGPHGPAVPDDSRLWAALYAESMNAPTEAFQLNHPYKSPRPAGPLTDADHVFRAQDFWDLADGQERKRFKVRSVRGQRDVPRIADFVRGDGEELFGLYSYRAFIATAPLASFVCLAPRDGKTRRRIAAVLIGSVRHPGRKRESEPAELQKLRIQIPVTNEPISTGYIAVIKVDPAFKKFNIVERLLRAFMDFAINVYAVTFFNSEIPDDNEELIAVYEDSGFRKVKRMARFYPDGSGSFWMQRDRLQEAQAGARS
jgi:ribosomal protein S18 acetylase RimI-like enzyme